MKIKVFEKNNNGNIELTKAELEALLTEAYNDGYADGKKNNTVITYPTYPVTWKDYQITCQADSTAIDDPLPGQVTIGEVLK